LNKSKDDYALIRKALSEARFESHRNAAGDSDDLIFARYQWHAALCEQYYTPLQILEVALRNGFNEAMMPIFGAEWLTSVPQWLRQNERDDISKSYQFLRDRSRPITQCRMVQEMSFGFWVSLLNSEYETLFHKLGSRVFPGLPKASRTRAVVSHRFNTIRLLRNRIFHFRRIWNRPDLEKDYNQILEAIEWVNMDARRLLLPADAVAKFLQVLRTKP
jgi:hypothetical protein